MQVGDVVLAVGNPLGVGQTVTMGIISAKGRSTGVGDGSYEDFLQTDAPINHGNSGGALVNTKGELVGINSQIAVAVRRQHRHRLRDSGEHGAARHGRAADRRQGARARSSASTVQPVTSDMAESLGLKEVGGAIVSSVAPGSAAERAGVKRGDVIKSFNGQPVHDFNSLRNRVADAAPGSSATVVVVRDGSEKTLTVKLDEATAGESRARATATRRRGDDKAALGVSGGAADAGARGSSEAAAERAGRGRAGRRIRTAARPMPASRRATSSSRSTVSRFRPSTSCARRSEVGGRPTLLLVESRGARRLS